MRRLFLFSMLAIAATANPLKQYILNVMTQGMDPMTRYLMQGPLGADLLDMDTGGQRSSHGSRYGSQYPAPYMTEYVPQYITQYVPLYVPETGPQYPQSPQQPTMVPPPMYPPSQPPSGSTVPQTPVAPQPPLISNTVAPQPPIPSIPVAPQSSLPSNAVAPQSSLPFNAVAPQSSLPFNVVAPQPPLPSIPVAPQPPLPSIPVAPQPPQLPSAVPPSPITNNQVNSNTVSVADKSYDNPYSPVRGSAGPSPGAMAYTGAGNLMLSPSAVPVSPQRYAAARRNTMANRFVDGFFTFKAMEGMDMI